MPAPFVQLPFGALPALPTRPHTFFDLPVQRVNVWTEALGDVDTALRVVGAGPPLLLVHGLMTTGYSWRYALPELAAHYTCYVPDLVGAGLTPCPDRRLAAEDVADWLVALQEALGIRGCDGVGNSMGGYLTMWAALRHPGAFRKLLNLHGPGVPDLRLHALWLAMRLPGSQAVLGALVRRDPRRWAHRNVHYWDESLKSLEEAQEYGDVLATDNGLQGFHRQLRDMMDVRGVRRFLTTLRSRRDGGCDFPVPLLLLYARHDPMVPPRVGRVLGEAVPDADLQWLEAGSHFAHVDATEAFVAAALAFFAS